MDRAACEQLGIRLRGLRHARRVSLKCLAHRLEISPSFLSRVERGLVPVPEQLVRRLAEVFDAEAEPLLVLAGRLPDDVQAMLRADPEKALATLRRHFGRRSPAKEPRSGHEAEPMAMEA